jgi:protein-S-isoprenylcysteine O-methyltransferase Ste14
MPAATLAVVFLASIVRGLTMRAQGVKAYGFGFKSKIQSAAERFWTAAVVLIGASALIAWLAPQWENTLGRPTWSHGTDQRWAAAAALTIGALIVLAGQQTMGPSWRVGVPGEGPGALVTRGLFRFSRNPVFVGMFAMTAGMFLWSPTLLSAAVVPLAAAMMAIQVRLEEEALAAKHGVAFTDYAKAVPRWVWPVS